MGCGKKEKPSGKKAFVSKLEILRPVLGGAQGRRHLRFPLQGVVLVFFTGVPLGLLAQGAYHFPFLPAVVLAVGTAGLDIPPKEGLLFLFAEPSHRRPFLSLATGLDITPAVGTSRRRLKPPDWPEVPTSRPAFAFSAAMIPYTCGGHVAQAAFQPPSWAGILPWPPAPQFSAAIIPHLFGMVQEGHRVPSWHLSGNVPQIPGMPGTSVAGKVLPPQWRQ